MKKQFFFTLVALLSSLYINAQFFDDLESYTVGESICSSESNANWQAWCSPLGEGCCMMATSDQSRTGIISGEIPNDGTTSALFNLGNKIFSGWFIQFYMYIPSNKEASFNMQGQIPPTGSGQSVVGNINFNKNIANPGIGFIDWDTTNSSDDTYFNFPHDEWFHIQIYIDLSMGISIAKWEMYLNQVAIVPYGTPFANGNGVHPTSLGGINFPSTGPNNLYYLDDFCYEEDTFGISDCFPLAIDDPVFGNFSIYPNPADDYLVIENNMNVEIKNIKIINLLGTVLIGENENYNTLNIKKLHSGTYIIKIETSKGVISKKIVKL